MANERKSIFSMFPNYESKLGDWETQKRAKEDEKTNDNIAKNILNDSAANSIEEENVKREVYLTFDDGLEAGTKEILDLLKEEKIKATFFIIGKRVESMYKRNKDLCFELLTEIFNNHSIGNHSYSHANEFYSDYYREGGVQVGVKNGKKEVRSVVQDFAKGKNTILYYKKKAESIKDPKVSYADNELKSKDQKKILARFPGTNTWYIKNQIIDVKYTNRGLDGIDYIIPKQDTLEEAKELGKSYNIFGWDIEWKMSEPHCNAIIKESINKKKNDGTIQYDNTDHTDPFFDLYSKELINYDRCVEKDNDLKNRILDIAYPKRIEVNDGTGPYSFEEVMTAKSGKIVLLMHDRQFRSGKIDQSNEVDINNKSELNKLRKLIKDLKKNKFIFKTLDEY